MYLEMNDEVVEEQLKDQTTVKNAGYLDLKHYEECKEAVVGGLTNYGDLFASALGYALYEADLNDSLKIMRYWNQLCEQHSILFKLEMAKYKAVAVYESKL